MKKKALKQEKQPFVHNATAKSRELEGPLFGTTLRIATKINNVAMGLVIS